MKEITRGFLAGAIMSGTVLFFAGMLMGSWFF